MVEHLKEATYEYKNTQVVSVKCTLCLVVIYYNMNMHYNLLDVTYFECKICSLTIK